MIEELEVEKPVFYGVVLAAFFMAGFLSAGMLQNVGQSKQAETGEDRFKVSKQTAVSNAENYVRKGPLSYPFTYNLSTVSIEKAKVGGNNFYNWTFTYTVEANPLRGSTYQIPENQTKAQKQMNIYISPDGTTIFPSQPIKLPG
jgi:hypothetical protein